MLKDHSWRTIVCRESNLRGHWLFTMQPPRPLHSASPAFLGCSYPDSQFVPLAFREKATCTVFTRGQSWQHYLSLGLAPLFLHGNLGLPTALASAAMYSHHRSRQNRIPAPRTLPASVAPASRSCTPETSPVESEALAASLLCPQPPSALAVRSLRVLHYRANERGSAQRGFHLAAGARTETSPY